MIQNRGNSGRPGIYEALIDEFLRDALVLRPDLRTVFGKIDPEEQPAKYASFVAKVLEQALREESDPDRRLALCNHILGHVANEPGRGHLDKHRLIADQKPILLEITPPHYGRSGIPRPHTSLTESSLFTDRPHGSPDSTCWRTSEKISADWPCRCRTDSRPLPAKPVRS